MRLVRQTHEGCVFACLAMILNISRAKAECVMDSRKSVRKIRQILRLAGYRLSNYVYLHKIDFTKFKKDACILYWWKDEKEWHSHILLWDAENKRVLDPTTWYAAYTTKEYIWRQHRAAFFTFERRV